MRKGAFRDETGTYLEELAEALRAAGLADEKTATPLARWMEQRSPGGLPLDNLRALRAAYAEELEGILPKAWEEAWEEAATRLPPGTSPSPGVVAVLLSLSDRLPPGALLQTHEVEGKTLVGISPHSDGLPLSLVWVAEEGRLRELSPEERLDWARKLVQGEAPQRPMDFPLASLQQEVWALALEGDPAGFRAFSAFSERAKAMVLEADRGADPLALLALRSSLPLPYGSGLGPEPEDVEETFALLERVARAALESRGAERGGPQPD